MRLVASIKGDLEKYIKLERKRARKAVTRAVTQATTNLKQDLRGEVEGAGLGRQLANTWRSAVYPKGKDSLYAAGVVFSKAPKIMAGFVDGVTIKSSHGFFLAIPTPEAPRRGVGGKRITPSNFPEHRFGPLRFVYRKPGPSLLVVDKLRARTGKRGGFAKASQRALRTGEGLSTVVMFWLVPKVRIRKRLDVTAAHARAQNRLPRLIKKAWKDTDE